MASRSSVECGGSRRMVNCYGAQGQSRGGRGLAICRGADSSERRNGGDYSWGVRSVAGVAQARALRGREFSRAATSWSCSGVCLARLVPLGKYCRRSPFMFSFDPRCHGECGSAK